MDLEAMSRATQVAGEVYENLLQQVVIKHALGGQRKGQLSEDARKRISKGSHIDHRLVHLMSISGKGGWHPEEKQRQSYARNHNITLLDHLLSVARGSVTLAALDWLTQTPEMELDLLRQRLTVMVAIAFLHDADKDLHEELQEEAKKQGQSLVTSRLIDLSGDHLEKLMQRYGMVDFLKTVNVTLTGEQMLYLLEKVEATQSHRHPPAKLPPRELERLPLYVRLADKLDGIWAATDYVKPDGKIQQGGMAGVLERLTTDPGCLDETSWLRTGWQPVDIFDPHHPFLLDELQRWLAFWSQELTGALPLIETHQDGRLLMLLPKSHVEEIVKRAIDKLCRQLPFQLELVVSNRGIPALYNGQPSHSELIEFMEKLPLAGNAQCTGIDELMRIQVEYRKDSIIQQLDELLGGLGLSPRLPKPSSSKLIKLYSNFENMTEKSQSSLRKAAHLLLLLNLKLETKAKDKIPTPAQREEILLAQLATPRPDWITEITDDSTRRVITALWTITLESKSSDLATLLQHWLEEVGFNRFITGRGAQVVAAVKRHFQQLLTGERVFPEGEAEKTGRCLFTDEPVDFDDTIEDALGLYGVKVSAFSGRDNRPESIGYTDAHTNISPVAIAEHKLRAEVHGQQGGKENGVPTLISSPVTTGLFGGLTLTNNKEWLAMSIYDLSRLEVKKGKVFHGGEMYEARYRMARLERMAEKTADQVNQLRMLIQACLRLGRPIHLFRGLPTSQRAFFYYDAMPRLLSELLKNLTDEEKGQALRLEQLPKAIDRLEVAQMLLETNGLGYDILRLYAYSATQFGAICLVWCHLHDHVNPLPEKWLKHFQREFLSYLGDQVMMKQIDNQTEGALVKLGKKAGSIQKYIRANDSNRTQMMVFNICLETVNHLRAVKQMDKSSLINGVAGELEYKLSKEFAAANDALKEWFRKECVEVAQLFVEEVWLGALKSHAPSQRTRRVLGSVYRMTLLQTFKEKAAEKAAAKAEKAGGEARS